MRGTRGSQLTLLATSGFAVALAWACTLDTGGLEPDEVPCEAGSARCGGVCVPIDADPQNCGGCGVVCANGQVCYQASCGEGCPSGLDACLGTCVDIATDILHCGGCGEACPAGAACEAGECTCGSDTLCGIECVDLSQSLSHCGTCDQPCDPAGNCVEGECTGPCTPGEVVDCYTGPAGTMGVGICEGGTRVCDREGQFGPCDDVTPAREICGNAIDEDCDGATPQEPCLDDTGLVVRYFLDEADTGSAPPVALDATPNPLDLTLDYGPSGQMAYVEEAGQRGLAWPAVQTVGSASAPIDGTKVASAFQTELTLEIVVDVTSVTGLLSRVFWIGAGQQPGRVAIAGNTTNQLQFIEADAVRSTFPFTFGGRRVLHAVYDSDAADPDKIVVYVDGAVVTPTTTNPPGAGKLVGVGTGASLYLGNRGGSDGRSFSGTLFYAALYDVAFTAARASAHATSLGASDDAN